MLRFGGWGLIAMAALHAVFFGAEALSSAEHWFSGGLWTTEHLRPFRLQHHELLASNAVFWATLGSAAVPLAILGALVLRLARNNIAIPSFVGWSLAAWAIIASLVMQPSGFPLAAAIGAALVIGGSQHARA